MSPAERWFNRAAGCSVLSWAVLGTVARPWSVPRCCLNMLHLVAASLFFRRSTQLRGASPAQVALCLPSFVIGGMAFSTAPSAGSWPPAAQVLFAVGTVVTAGALLTLGRSFAILPALRQVVSRGPYRIIRHPAYAGELVMVGACALAGATTAHLALLAAAAATMVLRIRAEETVLCRDGTYAAYAAAVVWRLVPGVY